MEERPRVCGAPPTANFRRTFALLRVLCAFAVNSNSYAETADSSANFVSIFAEALKKSWIDWLKR